MKSSTELAADRLLSMTSPLDPWIASGRQRLRGALSQHWPINPSLEDSLLGALSRRLTFFVRRASADVGQGELWAQCPWLSTLLSRVVEQWQENVSVMCRRLVRDRAAIERAFDIDLGTFTGVQINLGDPHAGGHTVSRWAVGGSAALIYKPRSVQLEGFFSRLLGELDSDALSFRGLDVLTCSSYGWIRAIRAQDCTSEAEVARFHRRLGALLAVAHVFGTTDLHEQNLIAEGEHPVLIDLETLITPTTSFIPDNGGLAHSVLDSGLLPGWFQDGDAGAILCGGIGGGITDGHVAAKAACGNLPRLAGATIAPFAYEAEVIDGFLLTWELLCRRKAAVVAACEAIRLATYRCVLRPTRQYWNAIIVALRPNALRSAEEFRSGLAHALTGPSALASAPGSLIAAELASLETLDIPYFVGTVDGLEVRDSRDTSAVVRLPETPWQALQRRLEELRPDGAGAQVQRIRAVFAVAGAVRGAAVSPVTGGQQRTAMPTRVHSTYVPSCSGAGEVASLGASYLDAARAIADQLESTALETRGAGLVWFQPRVLAGRDRWELSTTGQGLEEGRAGVAIFLAALARCTGERRYRALAERSLSTSGNASIGEQWNTGLSAAQRASLVYALTVCGQCLESDELLSQALALAELLEPQFLEDPGVARGRAGQILALLALHDSSADDGVRRNLLRQASAIGGQLALEAEHSTWQHPGFEYGASGISYALDRLDQTRERLQPHVLRQRRRATPMTGDGRWAEAAPACPTGEHDTARGFCHGTAGLAVATLAAKGSCNEAAALFQDEYVHELDHLCCGNAGLIDLSLELGRRGMPSFTATSQARAAALLRQASSSGSYRLRVAPGCQRPGLFNGLAGIGLMWLRQYDPQLPCVLLREPLRS